MPSKALSGVKIMFSDKSDGDFSLSGEGQVFSDKNAETLNNYGMDVNSIANMRQVHGSRVLSVEKKDCDRLAQDLPEADGLITRQRGIALAVRTADCVPIVLCDKTNSVLAVLHGGWRSLSQGIITCTFDEITRQFGFAPQDFSAVTGPGIQSCCYQVDQDMCGVFPEEVIPRHGDWFLDLKKIIETQLIRCGVDKDNIVHSGLCTCCNQKFFSYRRDKHSAGRMMTAAMILA